MMENRRGYSAVIGLLTVLGALLPGTGAQQQHIRLEYSDVTLVPKYTRDFAEVAWRINTSIVVEVEVGPLVVHTFTLPKSRASINESNGALTIRNVTRGDAGSYTSEVVLRNSTVDKTDIVLTVRAPVAINKTAGDDVTLVPHYTGDPLEIKWSVNGSKLAEMKLWPREEITLRPPQDRVTISGTDGRLSIRKLTTKDSGMYKAEVTLNNGIQETGINVGITMLQPSGLSGGIVALIAILVILVIGALLYVLYRKYRKGNKPINKISELERSITVKFRTCVESLVNESHGLLEDHLKSLFLAISGVKKADHGDYTAVALLSNGKTCTFTKEMGGTVIIKSEGDIITLTVPNTEEVTKLFWKKAGVTQFEWSVSGLKLLANNITLKPGSVSVNSTEGKESYKVHLQLEERPESPPLASVTFHPRQMSGKTQIIWKKDGQPVNAGFNRIQPGPNGDLTINSVTSEDKGKYTVQCTDKKLEQEFFLYL